MCTKEAKLPSSGEMEVEMAVVRCPKCVEHNDAVRDRTHPRYPEQTYREDRVVVTCYRGADAGASHQMVDLEGVIVCKYDEHRRPIRLVGNIIDSTHPSIPVEESANLHAKVPFGIKQDVQESERCHLAQCYKASTIMCRRAVQLALVDKGVSDGPMGKMLTDARLMFSSTTYALAEGIKDYGGSGAHGTEVITPHEAATVIFVTVKVLNELY